MKKLIVLLAALLTFASTAFAQLGSASSDLVFTPVTPCRLFDTRPSQGGSGAIAANGTKNFFVRSAASFATQGGAATDCGMTATNNIAAIAINVIVITPTTGGYITAYPSDVTKPLAATVNFSAGDVLGNASVVKVSQGVSIAHLSIFSTSQTDVAGDVVGYYARPVSAGSFECETTARATNPLLGNGNGNVTSPSCATGYVVTGGDCIGGDFSAQLVSSVTTASNGYFCAYKNTSANATSISAAGRCCRIPGR